MVKQNEIQKVWIMEIRVPIKLGQGFVWTAVKCSDGRIYTYDSEAEALKMLEICYSRAGNSRGYGEVDSKNRRIRQVNLDEVKQWD